MGEGGETGSRGHLSVQFGGRHGVAGIITLGDVEWPSR